MCFAPHVVNTHLKKTEKMFETLSRQFILDTQELDLVIKIKHGHHIKSLKLVQNTYENGEMGKRNNPKFDVPIPTFHQLPEICEDQNYLSDHTSVINEGESDYEGMSSIPQRFNHDELNHLTRDLNLSKEASELLVSRLKDKN